MRRARVVLALALLLQSCSTIAPGDLATAVIEVPRSAARKFRGEFPAGATFTNRFDPSVARIEMLPAAQQGLFLESEVVELRVRGRAELTVRGLRGDVAYEGPAPVRLRLPVGHYFVETDGDRTQLVVLPADFTTPDFFGAGPGTFSTIPWVAALQERTRPTWTRIGAGGWRAAEPERGKWDWHALDEAVDANRGRKIIVVADTRPDWLQDGEFVSRYAEYVRELARHMAGKVYAIEIWNEPFHEVENPAARIPGTTNPERLAVRYDELFRASRAAIEDAGVDVKLIGPAWSFPYLRVENRRLAALGTQRMWDAFTWHDYTMNLVAPDEQRHYLARTDKRLAWYRELYGATPLIVDEIGLYGQSALGIASTEFESKVNWYEGMCRAVKFVVMHRAGGVTAMLPHCLHGTSVYPKQVEIAGWDQSPAVEVRPRGPKPQTSAFLATCSWLNGAELAGQRVVDDRLFVYEWRRANGESLVIAWCRKDATARVSALDGVKVTDIFGAELSPEILATEPLLFHGKVAVTRICDVLTLR